MKPMGCVSNQHCCKGFSFTEKVENTGLLSTGSPTEPLDTIGGTLGFCGTPVEKHCCRRI